jgi:hypothetical protein
VVRVDRLADLKFEMILRQCGVYDEWDRLALGLPSLVHHEFC